MALNSYDLNSNKCPVCKTEYGNDDIQQKAVNYVRKYQDAFAKLIEEKIKLKTEIQELEKKLRAYENTEDSEGKYTNVADDFEIQELIDKLKHPLVVELIRNIINEDNQQSNNYVNPEKQYDLTPNKTEENTTNENLDDTTNNNDNLENNSQENSYTETGIDLTLDEQELVNNYKNPSFDFQEFVIKVSEPEESHVRKYQDAFAKLIEEKIKLKTEIQELEKKLRAYENTEDSEGKYTNVADDFEIQELIDKLKHPLVVELIRNIINEDNQQSNNYVNPEKQYDLTPNKTEENTTNENLDDTTNNNDNLENNSQENSYTETGIDLTLDEQELVNNYKNPSFDFQEFVIKVSEPEESQTNRWSGSKEATIFKYNHQGKGNYWIVNMNDCLYIVPQRKFKINEYSQETLFSTFDCRSYKSGKSENFVLIKPGKVTAINQDGWQLIEPGILQF